jgi:thiol-disulfide isomerase/thioredoxin
LLITRYFPAFPQSTVWLNQSIQGLQSDIIILHFWSNSCPACHYNMPHLQKLREEYGLKGLQVIGVHRPMGDFDLDEAEIRKVAAELGITEPCALDNDHKIGDALGVDAWPTYFLFDAEGRLRRYAKGNFGVRMIEQALIRMYGEEAGEKVEG